MKCLLAGSYVMLGIVVLNIHLSDVYVRHCHFDFVFNIRSRNCAIEVLT